MVCWFRQTLLHAEIRQQLLKYRHAASDPGESSIDE
jgi:hypothetical protein